MNIQAEKIELIKMLLNTESSSILKRIKAVFKTEHIDLWDKLSSEQRASVRRAQAQLLRGEGRPHKEVMKKYKKWLSK